MELRPEHRNADDSHEARLQRLRATPPQTACEPGDCSHPHRRSRRREHSDAEYVRRISPAAATDSPARLQVGARARAAPGRARPLAHRRPTRGHAPSMFHVKPPLHVKRPYRSTRGPGHAPEPTLTGATGSRPHSRHGLTAGAAPTTIPSRHHPTPSSPPRDAPSRLQPPSTRPDVDIRTTERVVWQPFRPQPTARRPDSGRIGHYPRLSGPLRLLKRISASPSAGCPKDTPEAASGRPQLRSTEHHLASDQEPGNADGRRPRGRRPSGQGTGVPISRGR